KNALRQLSFSGAPVCGGASKVAHPTRPSNEFLQKSLTFLLHLPIPHSNEGKGLSAVGQRSATAPRVNGFLREIVTAGRLGRREFPMLCPRKRRRCLPRSKTSSPVANTR